MNLEHFLFSGFICKNNILIMFGFLVFFKIFNLQPNYKPILCFHPPVFADFSGVQRSRLLGPYLSGYVDYISLCYLYP